MGCSFPKLTAPPPMERHQNYRLHRVFFSPCLVEQSEMNVCGFLSQHCKGKTALRAKRLRCAVILVNIFILEMSCNTIIPYLCFGCCMTLPKVSSPFGVYHPSVSIAHLGLKPCPEVRIFSALAVGPVTRTHVNPKSLMRINHHVGWFFAAISKLGNEHEATWTNIKAIPDPDPSGFAFSWSRYSFLQFLCPEFHQSCKKEACSNGWWGIFVLHDKN